MVNDIQQQGPELQMRKTRDYEDPANRHVQSDNFHEARKESRHVVC